MSGNVSYINRSLTNVFNELEFLKESGVISDEFYNQVTNALPRNYAAGSAPVAGIHSGNVTNSGPPSGPPQISGLPSGPPSGPPPHGNIPPGAEVGEVLYDFPASQPTDLPLHRGGQIIILEKLNADWWRGRDSNTEQEGIFPSNYVRINNGGNNYNEKSTYIPPANPQYAPPPANPQYSTPPPPNQGQSAPPYYPPPSTNYYQQPPPPQQVIVQQAAPEASQQQQPQQHHAAGDAFKKFGSKLGNAAIFGAGATIGSDIVNSIF